MTRRRLREWRRAWVSSRSVKGLKRMQGPRQLEKKYSRGGATAQRKTQRSRPGDPYLFRCAAAPPREKGSFMSDVLNSIKPSVRVVRAYTLAPHRASLKLNQNENPWDAPARIKAEVLRRVAERKWSQ